MQLVCPCCHARYAVEAGIADTEAREAVAIALRLPPPLASLLLQYLGLFRPAERSLSWSRAARLLEELHGHIDAGRIERHKRWWPAPLEVWRAALQDVVDARPKLTLPMKSHGYLYEVVVGYASRAEGNAEQRTEENRRHAARDGSGRPVAIGELTGITPAEPAPPEFVHQPPRDWRDETVAERSKTLTPEDHAAARERLAEIRRTLNQPPPPPDDDPAAG